MSSTDTESANVIYHQTAPDGQIHALVEQDERVAYFYLASDLESFPTKACWVRNLVEGPITLDNREMEQGLAPRLPRMECSHPQGAPPLNADHLKVIWFEEGNGAALLEGQEVVALIPPWSGTDGFHGYARDCKTENAVCWPLPNEPAIRERLEASQAWWNSWAQTNPWKERHDELLGAYEAAFGAHRKYYAIDGKKWPPKGLALFESRYFLALATLGVSLRPQPNCELYAEDHSKINRIEIGVLCSFQPESVLIERLGGWLSGMTNYPWYQQTWLGNGHTSTLQIRTPSNQPSPHSFALFFEHRALLKRLTETYADNEAPSWLAQLKSLSLPDYRGSSTNLLWAIPITAEEQQQAAGQGSGSVMDSLVAQPQRLFVPAPDIA